MMLKVCLKSWSDSVWFLFTSCGFACFVFACGVDPAPSEEAEGDSISGLSGTATTWPPGEQTSGSGNWTSTSESTTGDTSEPPVDPFCENAYDGTLCAERAICLNKQCVPARCGDGIQSRWEECDDGNHLGGDGCSAACKKEFCGDGLLQPGEECDDGNMVSADGCDSQCKLEKCGDGIQQSGEECDDGNQLGGDGCSATCKREECGDGIKQIGEDCDDGNKIDGDGCSKSCHIEFCGDKIVQPGEECDDGNTVSGDGCSSDCKSEEDDVEECNEAIGYGGKNTVCSIDLFDRFKKECGQCHVDLELGSFQVSQHSMVEDMMGYESKLIDRIESNDMTKFMPPVSVGGISWNDRPESDPVRVLSSQLRAWIDQGMPKVSFNWPVDGDDNDDDDEDDDSSTSTDTGDDPVCGNGRLDPGEECDDGNTQSGDGCSSECKKESTLPLCRKVDAERLPARESVVTQNVETSEVVLTQTLFSDFDQHCGSCHVDGGLGGFQVKLGTIVTDFEGHEDTVLGRIATNDTTILMPPVHAGGIPWDGRSPGDPVVKLHSQLNAWFDQGKPPESFIWQANQRAEALPRAEESLFVPDETLNQALTSIGSCLPNETLFASQTERSAALDTMFASADELPQKLSETDLFTLDSEELAKHGVISFSPAYQLWADNAKKMRYVKVPDGQKIKFDPETQRFDLPENTRFYKTFLKQVTDLAGGKTFRKIETRIILIRKDFNPSDGGPAEVRALFGTYAWNAAETEAELVTDAQRNGEPFGDRIFYYETNEIEATILKQTYPPKTNLLSELLRGRYVRHYAIPGKDRCVHCHMGSANEDFVLGFTPVQLMRRPFGQGGTMDPVFTDELSQLQRFIDLGIFEGLESQSQVAPLEQLGAKPPRNDHELRAQAYMVGNCSHCHNPRGFPSIQSPDLKEILDMDPHPSSGGIFGFDMTKTSPRISRGESGEIPIPYITPSLYFPGTENLDPGEEYVAPWRSLLYRNVDTPYTYSDNTTIYPHMPMHTSGMDCRARRIMADWMMSIPARLVEPELDEIASDISQPWEEVSANDADYESAVENAKKRLEKLHASSRYQMCEEADAPSILDEDVLLGRSNSPPIAGNIMAGQLFVPRYAHFTPYDNTDPPGPWTPRRSDWQKILVNHDLECDDEDAVCGAEKLAAEERMKWLLEVLDTVQIDNELREFALEATPLGLWKENQECDFSGMRRVSEYPESEQWDWMKSTPGKSAWVYEEAAGAMLFKNICANCHGREADSSGRQANTVSELSGGNSRVANFRDGLFASSLEVGGSNIQRVFGPVSTEEVSSEEWAARYMAWMTLGGTESYIPEAVLRLVNNTRVFGQQRTGIRAPKDGNMLTIGREICRAILPGSVASTSIYSLHRNRYPDLDDKFTKLPLIKDNGDAELWWRICNFRNPAPIRGVEPPAGLLNSWGQASATSLKLQTTFTRLFHRDQAIWQNQPVMDSKGQLHQGLDATNAEPWCVIRPNVEDQDKAKAILTELGAELDISGNPLMYCPEVSELEIFDEEDIERWSLRGASNAAVMVFLYLQEMLNGNVSPLPDYDRCEELTAGPQD